MITDHERLTALWETHHPKMGKSQLPRLTDAKLRQIARTVDLDKVEDPDVRAAYEALRAHFAAKDD